MPSPTDLTTYPDSYFVLHPLAKIQVLALTFLNSQGVGTSQVSAGEQIGIGSTFKNYQRGTQNYAYIVQIVDNDGFTIAVNYQTGSVSAGQTTAISTSWMAEESGVYTIKVFVWDGLGDAPVPLSEVGVTALNVVE